MIGLHQVRLSIDLVDSVGDIDRYLVFFVKHVMESVKGKVQVAKRHKWGFDSLLEASLVNQFEGSAPLDLL